MAYEGSPFFYVATYIFLLIITLKKRTKDIEIIEIKLEKELQEIKSLLLQLLKHDEQSESKTFYFFLFFIFTFLYTVLMFIKGLFFLCGKRVRLHFFEAQEHII
jgi:hypothetical protein